jgi:putative acetyltransferase
VIRPALPSDYPGIRAVVSDAFARPDEADLVERLRSSVALLFELVETENDDIVGHIAFSRLESDRPLFFAALAPLAVRTDRQGMGCGARLTKAALRKAKSQGVDAVLVLGDPRYYARFGFSAEAAGLVRSEFSGSPAFLGQALTPGALSQPMTAVYPGAFAS